jgi:hypothetical protein
MPDENETVVGDEEEDETVANRVRMGLDVL